MMRRTGFKRREVQRAPRTPLAPLTRPVVHGTCSGQATPKINHVRSPKLMKAYRAIPCQNCGRDDGTVCGAHANWGIFGKGKAMKAEDNRAASLCHVCHSELDQGSRLTAAGRIALWWGAHVRTVAELIARRMWPRDVPVPDISRNPLD